MKTDVETEFFLLNVEECTFLINIKIEIDVQLIPNVSTFNMTFQRITLLNPEFKKKIFKLEIQILHS